METEHMLENSRAKRKKKNLDMIAANNLKQQGAGFAGDTNVLTLITEDWEKELALMSKDEAAKCLLDELLKIKKNKNNGGVKQKVLQREKLTGDRIYGND